MLHQWKNDYFDWRVWNYRYKEMKKHYSKAEKIGMQRTDATGRKKPGIAFSFDDSFRVNDWYTYAKDLFGFYNVRATFNINAFHHYEGKREHSQAEIDMLLELQANGHEIAHHGFRHENAVEYVEKKGLESWLKEEIAALFLWMEEKSHSKTGEKFKRPVTFAFPHFCYNEKLIKALVPNYFQLVRGHLAGANMVPFHHAGFAPSFCIDSLFLSNPKNLRKILGFAKQTGNNLIFAAHSLLPDESGWEQYGWPMQDHEKRWRTSPEMIEEIIREAKRLEMGFYTTAELAGIATFIDRRFERQIRNRLSKQGEQPILISELYPIKELDLSNQGIANLDGIQYFENLEKLDISNNPVSDFRLLHKLPKLKDRLAEISILQGG